MRSDPKAGQSPSTDSAGRVDFEARELILDRLRIGGFITLPFIALYAVSDALFQSDGAAALIALKAIPLSACAAGIVARRVRWMSTHAVATAIACVLALGLTQLLSNQIEGDAWVGPILQTSLGLTAAVYLPWGPAAQAVVSAALFLMAAGSILAVHGTEALLDPRGPGSLLGMLIVLGNAPVVSSTIRSLLVRNREMDLARERVSDALSRRLEEANHKLERRGLALEEALEEAEKANVSKSRFLASISHEFRTPLTSILGFAAMLRNGTAGSVNGKQFDYASEICTSAEHLLRIVDGVLTHARIEANDDPLQLSTVPVDLLVEVACRQVTPTALEKEIAIRRSRPSGCHLVGDKQKLLQVLLNLLSNAIKFSPPKSEVGAEVIDRGESVEIVVWDRGIGLAPEHLDRVFRPFEQVESANRTSQKGTGLGLSICKRLVELHHGSIRAESKPGAGSRFVLTLPKSRSLTESSESLAPG